MEFSISKTSTEVCVRAPYNSIFVKQARDLGGKWTESNGVFTKGAWVFDVRDEDRVRNLCYHCYGTNGITSALVTVRVKLGADDYGDAGPVELHGRTIARAYGRDSGAKLGEGVVLLQGGFTSGGSMKNWVTKVKPGTVVLVRDFPYHAVASLVEDDVDVVIEEEAPVIDRAALQAEREQLLARLTAIDELLASVGGA